MKPAPAPDAAYERKMRLYGYLAEHEQWHSLRDIMTCVLGYLEADVSSALASDDPLSPEHKTALDSGRKKLIRDMKDLKQLGIEVETRNIAYTPKGDPLPGYRLLRGNYASHSVQLTPEQVAILGVAAALAKSAADNPIGEDALAAVEKLMPGANLGFGVPVSVSFRVPAIERNADAVTRRLHRLAGMMRRRHVAEFDYRKLGGSPSRREVQIFALGERVGLWYAVGRDLGDDRVKSFRISRMSGRLTERAADQGPKYEIPADFDVSQYIVPPWMIGVDEEEEIEVAFASNVAHLATAMLGDVSRENLVDGRMLFRVRVRNVDGLVRWLMTFGDAAEVLTPNFARVCAAEMKAQMEANRV